MIKPSDVVDYSQGIILRQAASDQWPYPVTTNLKLM